jgi:hypothetical protein
MSFALPLFLPLGPRRSGSMFGRRSAAHHQKRLARLGKNMLVCFAAAFPLMCESSVAASGGLGENSDSSLGRSTRVVRIADFPRDPAWLLP